eukprot:tig00021373_g21072.t1
MQAVLRRRGSVPDALGEAGRGSARVHPAAARGSDESEEALAARRGSRPAVFFSGRPADVSVQLAHGSGDPPSAGESSHQQQQHLREAIENSLRPTGRLRLRFRDAAAEARFEKAYADAGRARVRILHTIASISTFGDLLVPLVGGSEIAGASAPGARAPVSIALRLGIFAICFALALFSWTERCRRLPPRRFFAVYTWGPVAAYALFCVRRAAVVYHDAGSYVYYDFFAAAVAIALFLFCHIPLKFSTALVPYLVSMSIATELVGAWTTPSQAPSKLLIAGAFQAVLGTTTVLVITAGVRYELEARRSFLQTEAVERAREEAVARQRSAVALLRTLLPDPVIEAVHRDEWGRINRLHASATVVFVSAAGVAGAGAELEGGGARGALAGMRALMAALEALAERHGVLKIKSIGSTFMGVSGIAFDADEEDEVEEEEESPRGMRPRLGSGYGAGDGRVRGRWLRRGEGEGGARVHHTEAAAAFALDAVDAARALAFSIKAGLFECARDRRRCRRRRRGLTTPPAQGPLVSGVIGCRLAFDVFGDACNLAQRMCLHGVEGRVQLPTAARDALQAAAELRAAADPAGAPGAPAFAFSPPRIVLVKGRGPISSCLLERGRPGASSPTKAPARVHAVLSEAEDPSPVTAKGTFAESPPPKARDPSPPQFSASCRTRRASNSAASDSTAGVLRSVDDGPDFSPFAHLRRAQRTPLTSLCLLIATPALYPRRMGLDMPAAPSGHPSESPEGSAPTTRRSSGASSTSRRGARGPAGPAYLPSASLISRLPTFPRADPDPQAPEAGPGGGPRTPRTPFRHSRSARVAPAALLPRDATAPGGSSPDASPPRHAAPISPPWSPSPFLVLAGRRPSVASLGQPPSPLSPFVSSPPARPRSFFSWKRSARVPIQRPDKRRRSHRWWQLRYLDPEDETAYWEASAPSLKMGLRQLVQWAFLHTLIFPIAKLMANNTVTNKLVERCIPRPTPVRLSVPPSSDWLSVHAGGTVAIWKLPRISRFWRLAAAHLIVAGVALGPCLQYLFEFVWELQQNPLDRIAYPAMSLSDADATFGLVFSASVGMLPFWQTQAWVAPIVACSVFTVASRPNDVVPLWLGLFAAVVSAAGYLREAEARRGFELRGRAGREARVAAEAEADTRALLDLCLPRAVLRRLPAPWPLAPGPDNPLASAELETMEFESVAVLQSDIVGFSALSGRTDPHRLVDALNALFAACDEIAERHGVQTLRTAGGPPRPSPCRTPWPPRVAEAAAAGRLVGGAVGLEGPAGPREVGALLRAADEMRALYERTRVLARRAAPMSGSLRVGPGGDARERPADFGEGSGRLVEEPIAARIGVGLGRAAGAVVGAKRWTWELVGPAADDAGEMERTGLPARVHVTAAVAAGAGPGFAFEPRDADSDSLLLVSCPGSKPPSIPSLGPGPSGVGVGLRSIASSTLRGPLE